MTRSELIHQLSSANPHLSREHIAQILNIILGAITEALERGQRVELRGFGVFDIKWRGPRERRNPRTGKQVAVLGSYVPVFKSGKALRARLNPKDNGGGK